MFELQDVFFCYFCIPMMKRISLFILFFLNAALLAAQQLTSHKGVVKDSYNFWYFVPEGYNDNAGEKPLVVFLHGRSLCGKDLSRVRRYGPLNAIERGLKLDAMVLAPQNPGGAWNPEKVKRLVDWAENNYRVDSNRIYVIGMSLGGYGTIDFAGTYPDKIAAAMALCGGGTIKDMCGLATMPLWILHGTADRAVGVSASQKVVDAVRGCADRDRLIWTKLQGMNHGQLARVFYLPETYGWLLSHSLADSNRAVNRSVEITPSRLSGNIYRELQKNGNVHLSVKTDTGKSSSEYEAEPEAGSPSKHHTIRKGDTLGSIAKRYGTTVKELCRLNGIKSTTTLRIGRKLRVK